VALLKKLSQCACVSLAPSILMCPYIKTTFKTGDHNLRYETIVQVGAEMAGGNGSKEEVYDIVIIGGGPGGLSAAMYAARANLKVIVLDKSPVAGALGSTDKIENYPGQPGPMSGEALLSMFREQAEGFGARVVQSQVVLVDFEKEPKEVLASDGRYLGRTVIVATGSMGRKPSIKGEADRIGKGVSYCVTCDAAFFKDRVAMVGEIEVVLEELEVLARFAKKVIVISGTKDLRPEQQAMLGRMENVEVLLGHRVLEITGSPMVGAIMIADANGNESTVEASGVFVLLHGAQPIVDFLHDVLELDEEGAIKVNKDDMSTSVEGVFAIGDVASRKYRQVIIAASDGCIAALSADKHIHKRARAKYQWAKK
jgi:thioredoxin reductase (NADPH)